MNDELKILYEDGELIVCHKPAGVPVQSAKTLQKDMVSMLNNHLAKAQADHERATGKTERKRTGQGERPSVCIVHRLDQPVEGVLVFAKTKQAAAALSRQVSDGSMRKLYRAVCCARAGKFCAEDRQEAGRSDGRMTEEGQEKRRDGTSRGWNRFKPGEEYCLVDYLVKDGRTNSSSVAEPGSRGAKRAELSFRVLGREGNSCLLTEIELKTGRHHQIRVQMAHAGLPLYGDRKYNERWQDFLTDADRELMSGREDGKIPLALCAVSLSFRHPASGKRMKFETIPQAEIFSSFGFH